MAAYGFEIVQTLIVDIEPDEHVKRAMNEINAGESDGFFLEIWEELLFSLLLLRNAICYSPPILS